MGRGHLSRYSPLLLVMALTCAATSAYKGIPSLSLQSGMCGGTLNLSSDNASNLQISAIPAVGATCTLTATVSLLSIATGNVLGSMNITSSAAATLTSQQIQAQIGRGCINTGLATVLCRMGVMASEVFIELATQSGQLIAAQWVLSSDRLTLFTDNAAAVTSPTYSIRPDCNATNKSTMSNLTTPAYLIMQNAAIDVRETQILAGTWNISIVTSLSKTVLQVNGLPGQLAKVTNVSGSSNASCYPLGITFASFLSAAGCVGGCQVSFLMQQISTQPTDALHILQTSNVTTSVTIKTVAVWTANTQFIIAIIATGVFLVIILGIASYNICKGAPKADTTRTNQMRSPPPKLSADGYMNAALSPTARLEADTSRGDKLSPAKNKA